MFSKLKKVFLYLIIFYAILGFIVIPLVVKPQIIQIVEQETNSKIELGSLYFNPFIFKLELSDVTLKSLDEKPLASFKELMADVEVYSLARAAIHLKNLKLTEPTISLVLNQDKSINLLNILKESNTTKQESNSTSTMPRIIIESIAIKNGKVAYEDYTQKSPFMFSFDKIGFELKDIDTDDFNSSNAEIRLYTTLGDGGFVDFKTKVLGFKPLKLEGSLDFEASKLYTQWKYAQDILNLEVADGKISFHSLYSLNLEDLNATKIDNVKLSIENLRIKPKNGYKDVLNLESLYVYNTQIKPLQQSVEIDKVKLYGLKVKVARDAKGVIDWLEYTKVNGKKESVVDTNATKEPSAPWNVLVKDVALEKIALEFKDKGIKPQVTTQLNELNLYAQEITLDGKKPFNYTMNLLLNKSAKCTSKGSIIHNELDVNTYVDCQGFDIVHYNPYIDTEARKALKRYDVKLQNAIAGFTTNLNVKENEGEIVAHVLDANVTLDALKLNKRSTGKRLAGFKNFSINGIDVDTKEKSVKVEKVALNYLYAKLEKHKDGSLNIENLIEPRPTKQVKQKTKQVSKEKPYDVKLKHFAINGANASFKDGSLKKTVTNKIDRIYVNAYNIDAKKYSWLSYNLSMRVNTKGKIKTKGKLRHTPLKQAGSFDIKNISLTALTPYIQESAYVRVDDGRLSLKGVTKYEKSSKNPDLRLQGSLNLASLFMNDTQDDSLLLSLNDVSVKSYTLELMPNRLHVDEVDVDSFFVNAMIDENKTMNFAKLAIKNDSNETNATEELAVEVTKEESEENNVSFPVRIVKINYALGSAKFADYSIPLKFKTHIHDLDGVIYSVSNSPGDTTYVDITGEVDEYGSTRLKGSIDSSNPKAYTDLDFNFKNLELNSFSGYSATFAGHEIESGKLYLDLGYDILNSELHGENTVMIKQMKLGKEVEDENVTKLPLGFVIGLLEDSEGIIDINMPVEGNLDEPDFKYGALVLKTFGNLIAKAVTSPFKFLGSVMGMDAESLEFVAFEGASTAISPPEREKLDMVAKMMLKKPKISLKVGSVYAPVVDKKGLQKNKLIALVVEKSGIKNVKDHQSVMTVDMLEDIYEEMRDDEVLDQTKERLEEVYKGEEFDRAYQNELVQLCSDIQEVTDSELQLLATSRSEQIINYLTQEKSVDQQRVSQGVLTKAEAEEESLVKVIMEIEVK